MVNQHAHSFDDQLPLEDPTALARFGKLELVVRLLVEGFMIGQHKSPFKGASVEFIEHRQYNPGDEIRHIDWRAYGKTDKYFIKEFEEETNLRGYLLVDCSGSMAYSGSTLSKFDYARYLAAALGYLLLAQRDAVGLVTFDTQIKNWFEPSTSPTRFQEIVRTLEQLQPGNETRLADVFEAIFPRLKRRSLIIILSDFFGEIHSLLAALKHLRHARHELILFQIVAPEEEEFPFSHPTQFRSLENARHRLLVDPLRLRSYYLQNYKQFCRELALACGHGGIDYYKMLTNTPYQKALGAYLDARVRRKKH